jgi:pimeloyl-ACP methyl ester carboxylesterase
VRLTVPIGTDQILFRRDPLRNPTDRNPTITKSDPIGCSWKTSDSDVIQHRIRSFPDRICRSDWISWVIQMYTDEFRRSSFRGGLQHYKCMTSGYDQNQLKVFSGMTIKCPATFISGANDWGNQLEPGSLHKMGTKNVCEDWRGWELIDGAGHWVQEEQPEKVVEAILKFLDGVGPKKIMN